MEHLVGYQANSRFLPAAWIATPIFEFASRQEIDDAQLLHSGTLHRNEISNPERRLSPGEYLALLQQLSTELPDGETPFLLGQQLLPGHLGPLSHALLQASSLRQAIDILIGYQAWLSPLLAPHQINLGGQAVLYWTDSCITPRLRHFVVEMTMAAITGMCRWLSGERLPWHYSFNRTRPAQQAQYEVHLGSQVRFNTYLDAMTIAPEWLDRPWPRGSKLGVESSLPAAERDVSNFPRRSLLAELYAYLQRHIRMAPTLEQSAAAFATSPATFKRYLAAHGTHYQAELDLVRTHVTLHLIHNHEFSNEQIAAYLGFHDANNFRRSLKRWTGLTPSSLRDELLQMSV